MEKKIPYISRNYDDYKSALIELSKTYYPEMALNFNDASVGAWFIDLNAAIADELSYHIDRVFQETNINSAKKVSSIYSMARNAGFKVPGPKGAMCEVAFRCVLPLAGGGSTDREPDWRYAPIIKRGTKVSSGGQTFELMEELDFKKQFNADGASNRLIQSNRDSNKKIVSYTITKLAVVVAGETNIYKKYVSAGDIKPFMDIVIPSENVMNVESIIVKPGSSFQSNPSMGEFYINGETSSTYSNVTRFFEVDSLSQQDRWGDVVEGEIPVVTYYGYETPDGTVPTYAVTKGEWKNVKHKFVTEYTDKGYLKITFGAGVEKGVDNISMNDASNFAAYQITKMMRNNSLGFLPEPDSTIFILYRAGGGKSSNVAKGAINNISYLDAEITGSGLNAKEIGAVRASISVESTMESVSGKDMPTVDELRNMVKYSVAAQERCVTVKDYVSRVLQIPPKYGCPFRVGATEENNKIMLYMLGIDYQRHLDTTLPTVLVNNVQDYLANYRMINDFVEIKSGRIINLRFEPYVIIDKDYNVSDVINKIKDVIKNYMDINRHQMGDDIYVGDIMKEISKVDGVVNLIKLKVFNVFDNIHSQTRTTQATIDGDACGSGESVKYEFMLEIDLDASDGILYSEGDTMLEVKYTNDIEVRFKQR